jgi:hypothetical protein
MAYGDKQELNVDMVMAITVNGGTNVTLDQAVEDGRTVPNYVGSGQAEPGITTIDLLGAAAAGLMPAAGGPERYRVRIERLR